MKAMLDVSLLRKFQNTRKKNQFENTGKKNQQVSEQSVMDLRENIKELQFCQIYLSNMVHCLQSIPPQSWIAGLQKTSMLSMFP